MSGLIDLTGQRFGRLTVMERAENTPSGQAMWLCLCDCGKEIKTAGQHLRNGDVVSCGCLRAEKASKKTTERNTTHGKRYTRLYRIWRDMKERCYNHKHRFYKRYGGRGITICKEWMDSFEIFYRWASEHGYSEDLTIDRIDNDKGYSPDNCRWASLQEQRLNRGDVKKYHIAGEEKTISQWCKIYQKDIHKVCDRVVRYNWSIEEALDLVPRKK